jgi:hypothetical protein
VLELLLELKLARLKLLQDARDVLKLLHGGLHRTAASTNTSRGGGRGGSRGGRRGGSRGWVVVDNNHHRRIFRGPFASLCLCPRCWRIRFSIYVHQGATLPCLCPCICLGGKEEAKFVCLVGQ